MKIRLGFVSNSSSSSFIFIKRGLPKKIIVDDPYLDFESMVIRKEKILSLSRDNTHTEFGWEWRKYTSWAEKAVWAWLQIWYAEEITSTDHYNKEYTELVRKEDRLHPKKWLKMLNDVIKKYTDVDEVDWKLLEGNMKNYGAYIDHQSNCVERQDMSEIFESEKTLGQFIFNKGSYVATGNDNNSPPEGWKPCRGKKTK